MQVRNSTRRYGLISMTLHWLVALTVFGLFGLGWYMVDLSYQHPWYRSAPDLHRSIGILLFLAMVLRLGWRMLDRHPAPLPSHRPGEVLMARLVHWLLYLLLFTAMISGYLISTADGSSIQVFNWFEVPSLTGRMRSLEDPAGWVHYWVTWALVVLGAGHGLVAIKHHLIDRDDTLRRMLPVKIQR